MGKVAGLRRIAGRCRRAIGRRSLPREAGPVLRMRGTVERVSRKQITGVVYARPDEPPVKVTLELGNVELVHLWAADPVDPDCPERGRRFRFGLHDVWHYTGSGSGLRVRVDGAALPIALRRSVTYRPARPGPLSTADLRRRLADGYVFNQFGNLQVPRTDDREWKDAVLGVYERVRTVVAEHFGHDVFLIYGSLLGAVRENGFIGHDLDLDAAYVSTHRDADAVLAELYEISRALHEAGLYVRSHHSGLKVADRPGGAAIDLMHTYFADDGLKFAFGVAGTSVVPIESWRGTREFELAGHPVRIPVNAEELVEHMYGASWRVPNPGFDWLRDRTSRHRPIMVPLRMRELIRWNNHYRHFATDEPSAFALALLDRPDLPEAVLDIGCGDGRDAIAVALAGRRVRGIDRSPDGVAYAQERARGLQLDGRAGFTVVDATDPDALGDVVADLRRGDEPLAFYLRFVLHGIGVAEERDILAAVTANARSGDLLALEFRTTADTSRIPWRKYYRRLISTGALRRDLISRFGFEPVDVQEGAGFSPTAREDPHLARVLATRR